MATGADVTDWLADELTDGGRGGAQVVATRHGEPILELAVGTCPATGRPITPSTRFPWFSATKPIAAAALHVLADAGELRYDEPVATYLPDFGQHGKAGITLRQVLTHTGGFPDSAGHVSPDLFADTAALRRTLCALELEHEPGGKVAYHGHTATAVLSLVAAVVSGTDFGELVRATVLDRVGMPTVRWHPDSATTTTSADGPGLARVAESIRAATVSAVVPSGGLYGSASDLARFYDALAGGALVAPSTVAEMTRLDKPFAPGAHLGFGLHVIVGSDPALPTSRGSALSAAAYGHPGWTCTVAVHDPATATTVVALTNIALAQDASDTRLARVCTVVNDVANDRAPALPPLRAVG